MNLGTLRAEIRRLIKDTSGDSSMERFSNTILNGRINYVQDELTAITGMLEYRATDTNVVSGTAEYIIPITLMAIRQVLWKNSSGDYIPLTKTSEIELNGRDVNWRDDTGESSEYYESRGYVGLYPNPNVTRTAGLRIDGLLKAQDLTDDANVPFNSDYRYYFAHIGIAYGVARLCMMDESKFNEYAMFDKQYNSIIKEIMRQISSNSDGERITCVYEQARARNLRSR